MKHRWTTLLWELWAAQAVCAAAALPPGSGFHTCPALVLPGLALAAAVPTAWAAWAPVSYTHLDVYKRQTCSWLETSRYLTMGPAMSCGNMTT